MPSKGQRGVILKDRYHQHQKFLTNLTCLSPKPQFNSFRNQNKTHDSIISCHERTPLLHNPVVKNIPATWQLWLLPWDYRQPQADERSPQNACRSALRWLLCGAQRWLRSLGQSCLSVHKPSVCHGSELNPDLQHPLQPQTLDQTHLGPHTPQHAHV